ncbi:hypothetical protein [Arthrobacter sp. FW306-07-I]|nr:hypothetical protein [Arthrobacter sp. FW306-07-I]
MSRQNDKYAAIDDEWTAKRRQIQGIRRRLGLLQHAVRCGCISKD